MDNQFVDPFTNTAGLGSEEDLSGFVDPTTMPQQNLNTQRNQDMRALVRQRFDQQIQEMKLAQEAAFAGAKRGIKDFARGIKQTALNVGESLNLVKPGTADKYTKAVDEARLQETRTRQEQFPNNKLNYKVSEFVTGMAPYLAVPGSASVAVGSGLLRAGIGATTGAAIGTSRYHPQNKGRLLSAVIGGSLGAAPAAIMGTRGLIGKMMPKQQVPAAQEMLQRSKVLQPTVGQSTGNQLIQNTELGLSKMPFVGMSGRFQAQHKELAGMLREFQSKVGGNLKNKNLTTYLEKDILSNLSKQKKVASGLYDDFYQKASSLTKPVPLGNMQKELTSIINSGVKGIKSPSTETLIGRIKRLQKLRNIEPNKIKETEAILNEMKEGAADLARPTQAKITALKSAFDKDIAQYSKLNDPSLLKSLQLANKVYRTRVGELTKNKLISQVQQGKLNPDDILNRAIKNEHPLLMKSIMKGLSPDGQAAMRKAFIDRVMKKSLMDDGRLNLLAFNRQLKSLGDTVKSTFTKNQLNELNGIRKIITTYADGIKAAQSSGFAIQGAVGLTSLGVGMIRPGVIIAAGGVAKGLSTILSNPNTTKLLIEAAKHPIGSQSLQAITNSIISAATQPK